MTKIFLFFSLCLMFFTQAQIPTYYDNVNLNLTGSALKSELAGKISSGTTSVSYTPGVWNALKQTDLDPTNSSNVLLIYGYNDNDGQTTTDRSRNKEDNGGNTGDWNREHVYPKSLGNPNLGTSGPGSDLHHLRPADVSWNGTRGSRKFANGNGNAGITAQGHWYPGDEWKGDVARMMMFMYLRYGNRCDGTNVSVSSSVSSDPGMVQLFLEWNAQDPVSDFELQRNPIIQNLQGNRNPFIDNPAFATAIWGGPQAEDRFGNTDGGASCANEITALPYTESFESNFGKWSNVSNDDFDWVRNSGATPSSNTGPSSASQGSDYIFMESSSPNYSAKRAILNSPCLSPSSSTSFSFKYHMYGASDMGSLSLQASTDGTSWSSLWSKSGNQGNSWATATIDLGSFANQNLRLRFNGVTGTTWQGDMALDDFQITGGSTSNTLVDINIRLNFDEYPSETTWELRNGSGQLVYAGSNYGNQASGSTLNLQRSLEEGCYSFTIRDAYGDGMCCQYGNGGYILYRLDNGNTITSGGSFSDSQTRNFCLSDTKSASVGPANQKEELDFSVQFYPNPVQDVLQISTSNDQKISRVQVFNLNGQEMMTGQVNNNRLYVSDLPSGVYMVKMQINDQMIIRRVIKK
ncbi:endonuclease [Nonlabens xiamenensis]|uniref:endonuclease n=1 Tax=Nonlabens xiamenensis TaxID=2341043 RepID=UPI000F613FB1|nr:endonuclease [Nonlabens xiamenensis]